MQMDLDRTTAVHHHLDRLADDLGGRDVASDVVRAFLAELEPRLDQLAQPVDARRRVAHVLRSTALLVGLDGLAAAALALEHAPKDADVAALVESVRSEGRSGARDLRRWLAGPRG